MKALGPGLRNLRKTIEDAWALERDGTAPREKSLDEVIREALEELTGADVGDYAIRDLLPKLKRWLSEGDDLLKEANRIKPFGGVAETDEAATKAIARYLVTVPSHGGRRITKHIAALLDVAHGLELPKDPDARDAAWEQLLEKWKKALARASKSIRRSPVKQRQRSRT